MFSQRSIKYLLILGFAICVQNNLAAQEPGNSDHVDSPYRSEYNPWFKFNVLYRGYENEPLTLTLDSLESKPRKYWNRTDSLKFAQTSLKTGNIDLAAYYFHNLKVNYDTEEEYWWNHIIVHFLNREYNTCIQVIKLAEPGVFEYSKLYFFKQICKAKLRSLKDEKWYKTEGVLSWKVDSSLLLLDKDGPEFREKIIIPLENLRFVLEALIRHIHDNDEVIARTCLEMGWILETFISPTQAFIAMSLGRHYDKWDKEILSNIKRVKAELVRKKYRIPIFRKYFPRIEYWRFDYQMLKEKIIYEKNDTAVLQKPVLMKPKKKVEVSFPTEIIVISGLIIMIVLLILFLKTNKKK